VLQLTGFLIPATILAILALGLNLQFGHTGVFNAGVAAFVGVGAYLCGMLTTGLLPPSSTNPGHWGPAEAQGLFVSAIAAMAFAGILGVLVAIPTVRLRADYLAIATLAFAEIVRLVLKNERSLTGGDQGLAGIPRPLAGLVPESLGWASDGVFALIAAGALLVVLFAVNFLTNAPWGRSLRSVREDEEAAMALGKNTSALKLGAFAIGCAIMGLAGALTASFQKVVLPEQFAPFATFAVFVVVILGGRGNNRGVVLGAYLFWLFTWASQQLKAYLPEAAALRIDYATLVVVGVILVVLILFRPEGIKPEEKFVPHQAG